MRARDQVITVQGILSAAAVAVMLGYAAYTMQLLPKGFAPTAADASMGTPPAATAALASGTTSFTGVVLRKGSQYLLQNQSIGTMYKLDSETARLFEGKAVRVTGKLDATARTIHVEAIVKTGA